MLESYLPPSTVPGAKCPNIPSDSRKGMDTIMYALPLLPHCIRTESEFVHFPLVRSGLVHPHWEIVATMRIIPREDVKKGRGSP